MTTHNLSLQIVILLLNLHHESFYAPSVAWRGHPESQKL